MLNTVLNLFIRTKDCFKVEGNFLLGAIGSCDLLIRILGCPCNYPGQCHHFSVRQGSVTCCNSSRGKPQYSADLGKALDASCLPFSAILSPQSV